ncbi:hypothetical protein PECL_1895 (plasmid) [Pediococcus claussenii ATCC BAA-344]|uniref:Uncharacterized protein n=1 Tax=Pediococcus claussenii (strain ATCC BAA-344 / DSM 14800 / JCM 18046 / KCTC 3811 / LMG 21948 / P06) TaxID=701521 RepID=G8PFB4_PEDCP|nr:hypothetical protein PECL_1895 [Pediococcus claussenii ATCC BAA-344]
MNGVIFWRITVLTLKTNKYKVSLAGSFGKTVNVNLYSLGKMLT